MARKPKAQSPIDNMNLQEIDNTEELLEELVTAAKGMSGTKILDGILYEEYNQQLAGLKGMTTYNKMRMSDAQVSAVLLAMELPIRNAYWFIEPAKNEDGEISPENQEIADFVQKALFEEMQD